MARVIWGGGPLLQAFLTIVEVILVCSFGALLAHVVSVCVCVGSLSPLWW